MPTTWKKRQSDSRIARREEKRAQGIKTTRRTYLWRVEPERVPIPASMLAKAIPEFESSEDVIWLKPGDARWLIMMDTAAGGKPEVQRMEYRRCPLCKRMLIGQMAQYRRELDESDAEGRRKVCGPECGLKERRDKGLI